MVKISILSQNESIIVKRMFNFLAIEHGCYVMDNL